MTRVQYRRRYALAFGRELTPAPFWLHLWAYMQAVRLGAEDFDVGDAADNMGDYTPEEAAGESAWYWRADA